MFSKVNLAWSVPHGVNFPFRTTTNTCCLPAMFVPSWHDCPFARMYFSQKCSVCALLGGATDSSVCTSPLLAKHKLEFLPPLRHELVVFVCAPLPLLAKHELKFLLPSWHAAQTRCICLRPKSHLWPNMCLDLRSLQQ